MAPIFKPFVLASALFAAISSAAPVDLNKRDKVVVWETVTTVVWTTVDVTTTIYPTPQAPAPTSPVAEPTTSPAPAPEQPKPIEASEQPQPQVPEPQPAPAAPAPQPTQPVAAAVAAPAPKEPAPQPTPQPAPEPAPQPSPQPASQTAPQPAPPTSNSGSGSSSSSGYTGSCSPESPCVGQLTYYDTATSASAPSSCGMTNDGLTENVVALPVGMMTDADCGKTVTITYNGKTATGIVVDKCMGCDPTSCDISRHMFGELADLGAGRLHGVSWHLN